MKIGIHVGAWTNIWSNSFLSIIDDCKSLGLDFVEFPLSNLDYFDPLSIKQRCSGDIEVTCSAVIQNVMNDIGSNDKSIRNNGISFLKKCVDYSESAGSNIFTGMIYVLARKDHFSGPAPEWEWGYCADAIKQVSKYAAEKGITIGIEPTGRYHNHLLNTAEQGLRFLKMVDEKNVGIHLDSYHMCYEERYFYSAIRSTKGYLVYFHMNSNDRGSPGHDELIDWAKVFQVFKEINFDGYVGFEGFNTSSFKIYRDVIGEPVLFAKTSMEFVLTMMAKYGFKRSR